MMINDNRKEGDLDLNRIIKSQRRIKIIKKKEAEVETERSRIENIDIWGGGNYIKINIKIFTKIYYKMTNHIFFQI